MKQRITSFDLHLLTHELQPLLAGHRLQNIHDITTASTQHHQFLLKFNLPDSKHNIVVDSGFCLYETQYSRPIPPTPSNFVTKLRKHLKSRRLTGVKQVRDDRVIAFSFSEGLYYLVVEFFSKGNVILLDSELRIIGLLRLVDGKEDVAKYAVGEVYHLFDHSLFDEDSEDDLPEKSVIHNDFNDDELKEVLSKQNNGKGQSIQRALYQKYPFFTSDLIGKNLIKFDISPTVESTEYLGSIDIIKSVLRSLQSEVQGILESNPIIGYIVTRPNPLHDPSKDTDASLENLYDQFHPFQPILKDGESTIAIESYNSTLDKFFTTIESSKYALRIQSQESQARKKLESAKAEKLQQVQRLIDAQAVNQLKGETVIFNADLVEEVRSAVKVLIDQQMDWKTMEKLIDGEKKRGNPVASVINLPLNLKENKVSLKLSTENPYEKETDDESDFDSDSENQSDDDDDDTSNRKKKSGQEQSTINITIDLGLSSYANATQYFSTKKQTSTKQQKVEKSTDKALKNIEQNITKTLNKSLKQEPSTISKIRTPYPFEKFNWVLSNEGYLLLSGKDALQNEQIYRRYCGENDIYVHSNVANAAHVFILNPSGNEVSPSTLQQAGIMSLSCSKVWEGNVKGESSWWCFFSEISDVDQTGEKVRDGFRVLGEKRLIGPSQLVMGFGFLWKVKESEEDAGDDDVDDENENNGLLRQEETIEEEIKELDNDADDVKSEELEEEVKEEDAEPEEDTIDEVIDKLDIEDSTPEAREEEEEPTSTENTPDPDRSSYKSKGNKVVRGKKQKMKKMATKYAQQDEEERRLRMESLGTLKGQQRKEQLEEEARLIKQEKEEKQRQYMLKKEKEKEAWLQKKKNNKKDSSTDQEDSKRVTIDMEKLLDELSPTISKEDSITHAIPMFAPWPSLQRCRYRVKVQPGNTKKGKAVSEIMNYLTTRPTDSSESDRMFDWDREHDALKAVKDSELLSVIYVGKVKVMLPGKSSASKKGNGVVKKGGRK